MVTLAHSVHIRVGCFCEDVMKLAGSVNIMLVKVGDVQRTTGTYARSTLWRCQSWSAAYSFSASIASRCRLRCDIWRRQDVSTVHAKYLSAGTDLEQYTVVIDELDEEA